MAEKKVSKTARASRGEVKLVPKRLCSKCGTKMEATYFVRLKGERNWSGMRWACQNEGCGNLEKTGQ